MKKNKNMKKKRIFAVLLAACLMMESMSVCAAENAAEVVSGEALLTQSADIVAVTQADAALGQLDLRKYHTINILGDSITEGVGASEESKSYPAQLASLTGAKVNNYGLSGSRMTDVDASIASFVDRIYSMDRSADLVIVFGGTNDFWNGDCPIGHSTDTQPSTFYGALNTMMSYLKNTFQNADIVFITPYQQSKGADETHTYKTSTYANFGTGTLKEYRNAILDRAEHYSIPVLDLYVDYDLNTVDNEDALRQYGQYLCDGCHLNDAGYQLLAGKIHDFIMQDLSSYVPQVTYVNGMVFETAALPALIYGNGFMMPNGSYIPVTNGVVISPEMDLKILHTCLMQSI